jgi:4-amino-4-deoxy-L-arabinose transferase-like glycosyltransferase
VSVRRLTWSGRAGLAAVVLFFWLPLYIGLGQWDLRSDEAIYSYAVDRILETGDWLTPRSIPTDDVFLEKPPLKFWIVAGLMRLHVTPADERGMRLVDVTFAGAAFVYVFLLGWRLGGTAAGLAGVFLLFAFDPLVFEHGVRGNNMEAALLLAYCGGIFHFVRWTDDDSARSRRRHALALGGYFVLGFMTKFVAILFLPMICAVSGALAPDAWRRARATWTDWLLPAALALAAIVPWFAYQTVRDARRMWGEIFGAAVLTRFTGVLVPEHLKPWHHYVTQTWAELGYSHMRIIVVIGAAALVARAWRGRDWFARLLIVWLVLPVALMSLGTSKVFYYVYPFFPPLALGGGLVAALIVRAIDGPIGSALAQRLGALVRRRRGGKLRPWPWLAGIGVVALLLAAWTAISGPVTLEAGGVRLFRNSSAARAGVLGVLALLASGVGRWGLTLSAAASVALALPITYYVPRVERFASVDHPLQTIRDCGLSVQARGHPAAGVLHDSGDLHHSYFYYLRRLGPWVEGAGATPRELHERLTVAGRETPVLLSKDGYQALGREDIAGISIGATIFILLPGPYSGCADAAAAAGGARLGAG